MDSLSGERLMSVIDPTAAFTGTGKSQKASWKEVSRAFDHWAQRLSLRSALGPVNSQGLGGTAPALRLSSGENAL